MNTRARAARILAPVLRGKRALEIPRDIPDAALCAELCFGTLRWLPRLKCVLDALLTKPLRSKDADIEALMLIGLYQLDLMRIPDHAAVAETVGAARQLGKNWAASLINAVLRNRLRSGTELDNRLAEQPEFRLAHPAWMIESWTSHWPDQLERIITANNQRPPMSLRVNCNRVERDEYLQQLAAAGIEAEPGVLSPVAVILQRPMAVEELPGFGEGLVSVQDEAAQLCAALLNPLPGERILDACAAPGGKTCHLLEFQNSINLDAADVDSERLQRVADNLQRLALSANLMALDSGDPAAWNNTHVYDRILLDAPCSGTGVIRRHPDIKWLRRAEDIQHFTAQQMRLLDTLWNTLKPNGLLLYVTCSIMPEENSELVAAFLACQSEAKVEPIVADWGIVSGPGRQLLPDSAGTDGFYFAMLRKHTG